MNTCEPLKHARCDIIVGAFVVMRRSDKCEPAMWRHCSDYESIAFLMGWELTFTDFGTCESEPGFCHAESLFQSLKRGTDYTRNCGVHHVNWRVARKAERRL